MSSFYHLALIFFIIISSFLRESSPFCPLFTPTHSVELTSVSLFHSANPAETVYPVFSTSIHHTN